MVITNEIKAKVFAQYLGQKCQGFIGDVKYGQSFILNGHGVEQVYKDRMKLILKPLSEITDDDAIEFYESSFFPQHQRRANDNKLIEWGHNEQSILQIKSDAFRSVLTHVWKSDLPVYVADFLRFKGYDLPNYLLGGKTLHEAGLAIYEN